MLAIVLTIWTILLNIMINILNSKLEIMLEYQNAETLLQKERLQIGSRRFSRSNK